LIILFPIAVLAKDIPSIRFRPSNIKFHEAEQHQQLQQTLAIKNTGKGAINVRLRSSCECLSIIPETAVIPSNNIQQIFLRFDTQDRLGKIIEYIFVDSNDPVNPHVTLVVEGMVKGNPSMTDNHLPRQTVAPDISKTGISVCLVLFSTPNCKYCQQLKSEIIPQIGKKHGANVKLEVFEINQPKNYERLLLLEKQMGTQGTKNTKLPIIFINNHMLYGREQIRMHLENEIKECVSRGGCNRILNISSDKPVHTKEKFASIRLIPILIAGLLDGINPCAFATIIFFLSYLVLAGRGRKEILLIGISFTAAVFLTYVLIGLGIFHVLKIANFRIINYLIASMTIILGMLSLRDYLKIKQGKRQENIPQTITKQIAGSNIIPSSPDNEIICSGGVCPLPKARIHQNIYKHGKTGGYILSSFGLGMTISILEFSCTGQIYVPTLMYMTKISGLRMMSFGYLILYNLMFVVPLIIIFLLSYNGIKSKTFSGFAEKHVVAIKLAITIFFFCMGILLVIW
jgi:cytochrome c biogenesis protein CcdA/glutaredoxin